MQNYDICVLTETKLDNYVDSTAFNLTNYQCNRFDRNANGGGVLTYINNDIYVDTLSNLQHKFRNSELEVTIDTVRSGVSRSSCAIIIGLYRPPSAGSKWFDLFTELITELLPMGNLILLGDLNCNLLSPNTTTTKKLNNILEMGQLKIPDVFPTRIAENSATCIDLIALNRNYGCKSYSAGELAVSDHLPVEAEIEFVSQLSTLVPNYSRNFNKIDYSLLNLELSSITLPIVENEDPESLLQHWTKETEQLLDIHAPLKAWPKRKNKLFTLPPDIIGMIHSRDYKVKCLKADPLNIDLVTDLKLTQRTVKSHITKFKKTQAENALTNNDTKEAWKVIKQALNQNPTATRPPVSLSDLNNYFSQSTSSQNSTDSSSCLSGCSKQNAFTIQDIPSYVVSNYLKQLKISTSTGPDGLPARFLKKVADAISPNIANIYNTNIKTGRFPDSWKLVNITAIYKGKGSKK